MYSVRILHTEDSKEFGGQELRVLREAVGMQRRGHVVVLALHPKAKLFRMAQDLGLQVLPVQMDTIRFFGLPKKFRALISRLKVDIVNTHGSIDSWTASLGARFSPCRPIIIRTRHKFTPIANTRRHRFLYQKLPHAIITASEAMRLDMIQRIGVDPQRIRSIPTGVDLQACNPCDLDTSLRRELHLSEGQFLVGTVAQLRREKGLSYFIKAAALIVREYSNVRFVIIGSGPEEVSLRHMVVERGLSDYVFLLGFREGVPAILASMDVFVLPSLGEGTPQTLTQALAMKRPVVATRVGGIPEVIQDGVTGFLVPSENVEQLAEKIGLLLQDQKLRERFGEEGRKRIVEHYSFERMLDRTEDLYRHLLDRRERPSGQS